MQVAPTPRVWGIPPPGLSAVDQTTDISSSPRAYSAGVVISCLRSS